MTRYHAVMASHDHQACDHHHPRSRASKAQLRAASATAKDRAEKAGLRWTAQRERALEILLEAQGPVKAYDLMASFQPGVKTAPPTVYRALDALVDLGMAHKIASQNAYVACSREEGEAHAASFLFCDCCGAAEEFAADVEGILAPIRAEGRFEPRALSIEVHGLCALCKAAG